MKVLNCCYNLCWIREKRYLCFILQHTIGCHTHKPLASASHTALPWLPQLGIPKISPASRMWSHCSCNVMVQQRKWNKFNILVKKCSDWETYATVPMAIEQWCLYLQYKTTNTIVSNMYTNRSVWIHMSIVGD